MLPRACSREMKRKGKRKLQVAFFPYKSAMVDSMKTIYLAAKADKDCDAIWCPIPYYDRNYDLSFGQMHYDGDAYGEEFEVTDWREYDVEARHPDIIFIHYGYDEYNAVTVIHPDFFFSRLKDLTDLLVYVDYGITMWAVRRFPQKL